MTWRGTTLVLVLMFVGGVHSPLHSIESPSPFEKYLAAGTRAQREHRDVEAEEMFNAALAAATPSDARRLGIALNRLAWLYERKGDETKASQLREKALQVDEQTLGPTHARVIADLNGIGVFASVRNEDAEAERLFKRALELQEQNAEVSEYQKVSVLDNLSDLYFRQRRYAECEPLLERAIEIIDHSSGQWDPQDVVRLRGQLLQAYRLGGNENAAQEVENHAHEAVPRSGDASPDSIQATLEQADDAQRDGNLVAAEDGYREVIAATENKGGLKYDSILYFGLNGMGRVCAAGQRDDEAAAYFLRAIEVRQRCALEGNRSMARVIGPLAPLLNLYQKRGRLFDMEPVCERALSWQEKALGPDDEAIAETLLLFASVYMQQQKFSEALPLYARAVSIQEKNLGPSVRLAGTLEKYADVLQRLDQPEEAQAARSRADSMLKQFAAPKPVVAPPSAR